MKMDNGYFVGTLADFVDRIDALTLAELLLTHVPNDISLRHAGTVVLGLQDRNPCRFMEINGGGIADAARFTLRMR